MALWQYTFYIIPKESIPIGKDGPEFDEEGFDSDIYWKDYPTRKDYFRSIGFFLPEAKSWSPNLIIYGDLESNCFEFFFEEDLVVSVSFRIDFTSRFRPILDKILSFLKRAELVILDENHKVVPLEVDRIVKIMNSSPQARKLDWLSGK